MSGVSLRLAISLACQHTLVYNVILKIRNNKKMATDHNNKTLECVICRDTQ